MAYPMCFKLAIGDESVREYLISSLYITPVIPAMDCCATVPKSDNESVCLCAALLFRLAVHSILLELRKLLFRRLSNSSCAALLPLWGLAAVLCLEGCKCLVCTRSAVAPACRCHSEVDSLFGAYHNDNACTPHHIFRQTCHQKVAEDSLQPTKDQRGKATILLSMNQQSTATAIPDLCN